jgi:transposase
MGVSLDQAIELRQRLRLSGGLRGAAGDLARELGVSRATVYNACQRLEEGFNGHRRRTTKAKRRRLQKAVGKLQEELRFTEEYLRAVEDGSKIDERQLEEFVLTCAVRAVTLRGIVELVGVAFGIERSHTWAKEIIDRASAKAQEIFEQLRPWTKASRAVGDEIFLGACPLLVVADPGSLAVLRLAVEEHRDKETWAKLLGPLGALEIFASDLGKGLTAAVEARGWPHQADLFHALRILSEAVRVEERRCYQAIEEEYAWEERLRRLQGAEKDTRGVATNHALARKKTDRALERFSQIEQLVHEMRSAVRLCDELGRWIPVVDRERRIATPMAKLEALGLARRRKVAGYWRNPKLLTFARQIESGLEALTGPSGEFSRKQLLEAAVGAWALKRGLVHGQGAMVAQLRAVAAAQARPEFGSWCAEVAPVMEKALRASSAIETLNSLWRVYQQVKKSFGTKFAYLVALYHNMRPFSEGPRKGRSPFGLLGVPLPTDNWLELLRQ